MTPQPPAWPPIPAPTSLGAWRRQAQRYLAAQGSETAELDARLLAEEAFALTREALLLHAAEPVEPSAADRFLELVRRRGKGVPVGRLLGWREFWGLRFHLGPDTLEPRPDSETLVEAVLAWIDGHGADARARAWSLVDLGTGTGCLILSLLHELPNATGTAIDKAPGALAVAEQNAVRLGLDARCRFAQDDWDRADWPQGMPGLPCDIVISNPPYLASHEIAETERDVREHDPHLALDGGPDGMGPYRRIFPTAAAGAVVPGGLVAVEIGSTQGPALCGLAATVGLQSLHLARDLGGRDRAILGMTRGFGADSGLDMATKKTVARGGSAG